MAIKVTNSNIFGNRFRNEKTEWLLAVAPETITATIDIAIGWFAIANTSSKIKFNPGGYINSQEIIKSASPVFAEFKNGDNVDVIFPSSPGDSFSSIITEKISDSVIRLGGETFITADYTDVEIIGKTPITGFNFFYGLIENSEALNFISKIDGSNQKFIAESIDATDLINVVPLLPDGLSTWQNGSATIKGAGVDTYYQYFTIAHEFIFLPSYLGGQFADLQNGLRPSYFDDINCLKYVAKFIGLYLASDPNKVQTGLINGILGNTGLFNENFNNEPTKYSIQSIVHKNPYNVVLSGVELTTTENTFEIIVKNLIDAPFSNTNTKVELGFSLCPGTSEYKDSTKNVVENFALDKALLTVGGATLNGDLFGTDEQIFKDVKVTFTSTSELKIAGKFALTQNLIDRVEGFLNHRYLIYVITQDHLLPSADADKVSLLVGANAFYQNFSEVGLIQFTNTFFTHNDPALVPTNPTEFFPGDEIIFNSLMQLDLTGLDGNLIDFKTLTTEVYATNGTDEFILESNVYNFANDLKVAGVTFVNSSQNRNFKLPLNDARRLVTVKRRTDLDFASTYGYEINYAFAYRWEYWVANALVDNAFFSVSEPQNGKNNFWHRFNSLGFTVNIRHKMRVDNNGYTEIFETSEPLPSADYDANPDWINTSIKSYDATSLELNQGGNKYVQGFAETKIEASFEKTTPFNPADIVVVIWAEVFEAGGVAGRTRISSIYDVGSESWFKGVAALPLKVNLTFGGGNTTVLAEAVIENTKLPVGISKIEIYSRIYDGLDSEFFLLLETGFYVLQENLGKIKLP